MLVLEAYPLKNTKDFSKPFLRNESERGHNGDKVMFANLGGESLLCNTSCLFRE